MKYLKIENKKAEYYDGENYKPINDIGKKDLLFLLDSASGKDFELDPFDENELPDPAQRIIYKNIAEKFEEFLEHKTQFTEKSEKMYVSAIAKYMADQPEESATTILGMGDVQEINPEDIPF